MRYYIKEWHDKTATLYAEDGYELDIFESVDEASEACINDCRIEPDYIERHFSYLASSPIDFESSYI